MKSIKIYKETYYKIEDIKEFIEQCKNKNDIILSLEFFQIIDAKVVPYSKLQSIDSSNLYDENKSSEENAIVCNNFINYCIDRIYKELGGLYFSAIVD